MKSSIFDPLNMRYNVRWIFERTTFAWIIFRSLKTIIKVAHSIKVAHCGHDEASWEFHTTDHSVGNN